MRSFLNNHFFGSSNNEVTVRIWLAKNSSGKASSPDKVVSKHAGNAIIKAPVFDSGNVGHASVQTRRTHTSFWPDSPLSSLKGRVEGDHHSSPLEDERSERGAPDTIETFVTLDVKAIDEEHARLEQRYALKGEKAGLNADEKGPAHNCSTAAYQVLRAGGINDLSPVCRNLLNYKTITPNQLDKCIKSAKQEEDKRINPSLRR